MLATPARVSFVLNEGGIVVFRLSLHVIAVCGCINTLSILFAFNFLMSMARPISRKILLASFSRAATHDIHKRWIRTTEMQKFWVIQLRNTVFYN